MAAGQYQGAALDPKAAEANVRREVAERTAAGTPIPTTALMSGDIGLQGQEARQRAQHSVGSIFTNAAPDVKAKHSFGARDTALRDQAVSDVNSLRPEAGVPVDVPVRAAAHADELRGAAQRDVERAQDGVTDIAEHRAVPANALGAFDGAGPGASRNIHEIYDTTRTAEQDASRARFNDPVIGQTQVPRDNMRAAAEEVLARGTEDVPLPNKVRRIASRFIRPDVTGMTPEEAAAALAHADRPITMWEINALREEIEAGLAAAVRKGDGRSATLLRRLKGATGEYQQTLIDEGGAPGAAMADARQNFAERVAPNFRQGTGGELNDAMRRDANLRPSETIDTFITRPEDSADLARIGRLGGNEAAVESSVRTKIMDDLARRGIAKDGAIDPEKLATWRTRNEGIVEPYPRLAAELNQMEQEARTHTAVAGQRNAALTDARAAAAHTETDIRQGALGLVAGKDHRHAIADVLGSGNPKARLQELMGTVGATPQGKLDLQAAVVEHMVAKISDINPAAVSSGEQNINFNRLMKEFDKHEKALTESGLFSPEDMNRVRQAKAQLEPLTHRAVQATAGSITAERFSFAKLAEPVIRLMRGALQGGAEVKKLKILEALFSTTSVNQANRLALLAAFDPKTASILLLRNLKEKATPLWNNELQAIIRRVQVGKDLNDDPEHKHGLLPSEWYGKKAK